MTDEGKLHDKLAKGERAIHELNLTREAFAALKAELTKAWLETKPTQTAEREKLWVALTQLTYVENALLSTVQSGKVAAAQITQIREAGEAAKKRGLLSGFRTNAG